MIKKLFEIAGKNRNKVIQGTVLKVVESGVCRAKFIISSWWKSNLKKG